MSKVTLTIGLPGSGKTTWAMQECKNNPNTVRVNKDSLRLMMYGEPYRIEWEDFICTIRDSIIDHALDMGHDVIVDDTNFSEKHINRIAVIANYYDAAIEIKDFTDIPKEVCLERNRSRSNPVPEEAIHHMHEQYIIKDFEYKRKFPRNPRGP